MVERILAIDVGAGTQDILLWESDRSYENCVQLILPSHTQIFAGRIGERTAAGLDIYLTGALMGGGASSDAVAKHLPARRRSSWATWTRGRCVGHSPSSAWRCPRASRSPSSTTASRSS